MINIVQARAAHADQITPKDFYLDNPNIIEEVRQAIIAWPSISFISEQGEIIAIIGLAKVYPKTGELWALMSDLCAKYPLEFARKAKKMLESLITEHKLKRVQMVVRSGLKSELDFAIFLGFIPEGIMRSYGPEGADYIMMGRVA